MNQDEVTVQIDGGSDGQRAYADLSVDYHETLASPLDDMWAAFADNAEPLAIVVGDDLAGCASVDENRELHRFFVRSDFDHLADHCFVALVRQHDVRTVAVFTGDAGLVSSVLPRRGAVETVALVYRHEAAAVGGSLSPLRRAAESDLDAVVEFMISATGAGEPWIRGYITERIERGELLLHEADGEIAGAGEMRLDRHAPGHAHLGIVVGSSHRNRGLGSLLMNALVEESRQDQLEPLCSTEPSNLAAQKAIRRAGFRSRHRIFRITLAMSEASA